MKKQVWYNPEVDYLGATGVNTVTEMAQLILQDEEVLSVFDLDTDADPAIGDVIRALGDLEVEAIAVPGAHFHRDRWGGEHVRPIHMDEKPGCGYVKVLGAHL